MLVASLNAFFCASPIYGSAEDFTFLLNFTPCENVTPAAKQQVGETRKKRLAQRPAFFRFDLSFGIIKGEQPLIRASRASKVAGAFLVLFWHAKENLALPQQQFNPRHRRAIALFLPRESKSPRTAHSAGAVKLQIIESALSSASCERSSQSSRPDGPHGAGREPCKPCRKLRR